MRAESLKAFRGHRLRQGHHILVPRSAPQPRAPVCVGDESEGYGYGAKGGLAERRAAH